MTRTGTAEWDRLIERFAAGRVAARDAAGGSYGTGPWVAPLPFLRKNPKKEKNVKNQ